MVVKVEEVERKVAVEVGVGVGVTYLIEKLGRSRNSLILIFREVEVYFSCEFGRWPLPKLQNMIYRFHAS